jgi:hypothetical protein
MTLMGFLGNIGGLIQCMTIALCLFIEPISEHTFYLKAISSFYLVKSKTYPQIFKKKDEE